VALVSGGSWLQSVELYSPNVLCSYSLASMPDYMILHGIAWRNKEIIACGGLSGRSCYIYFIPNNTWSLYNTAKSSNLPYTVYNGKLYFSSNGYEPQILDLANNAFSVWPLAPSNNFGSCDVAWRDTFIRFGGTDHANWILMYNHSTQIWSTLTTNGPRFYFSGCTLINGDKVFVAGYEAKYYIYNILSNQWIHNGTLFTQLMYMGVVNLGSRVFVLQGTQLYSPLNIVQELDLTDYSLTNVSYPLKAIRNGMAAITVPAKLFRKMFPQCVGVN